MSLGVIFTSLFSVGLVVVLILYYFTHRKYNSLPENERDLYRTRALRLLGLEVFMLMGFLLSSMTLDERKPYEYPIVDRMDINGQYDYIDVWENPKTKCRYLIHQTRVSTSKPEINLLPNGKPDCPANR